MRKQKLESERMILPSPLSKSVTHSERGLSNTMALPKAAGTQQSSFGLRHSGKLQYAYTLP